MRRELRVYMALINRYDMYKVMCEQNLMASPVRNFWELMEGYNEGIC